MTINNKFTLLHSCKAIISLAKSLEKKPKNSQNFLNTLTKQRISKKTEKK